MCHRKVECVLHSCGHSNPQAESLVDCGSTWCRYSSSHDADCKKCTKTCNQWCVIPGCGSFMRTDAEIPLTG
ncbi:hypothetical protein FA13DRAFT_1651922 [Coprinellus micaceus]|uniref:Uncharacterized protein n=1 Tax=Coprinellus micaceus TaxID=71717 RepID=A0A4Y7RZ43_COPMI|nr:hypothetical protein FA13DRAFT_1651922 [Coprinellus micaceus]